MQPMTTAGGFLQQSMTGLYNTVNTMWGHANQSATLAAKCMANAQRATDGLGELAGLDPAEMDGRGLADPSQFMTSLLNNQEAPGDPSTDPIDGLGAPRSAGLAGD